MIESELQKVTRQRDDLIEALKDIKNRAIRIQENTPVVRIEASFIERIADRAMKKAEAK